MLSCLFGKNLAKAQIETGTTPKKKARKPKSTNTDLSDTMLKPQ
jgi:hypothetical protein